MLQQQADGGIAKDITADIADWSGTFNPAALAAYQLGGKTYGVPYDIGMVGFWYNKDLFKKAGVEQPPATWTEFLDAVNKLKAANITPIALGGKAKWPGHYYWTYLAMRIARPARPPGGGDRQVVREPRLHRRRAEAQGTGRPQAVPERLPGRPLRHPRRPGRRDGQRQGRHGADGPVGADRAGRTPPVTSARRSASSLPRGRGRQGRGHRGARRRRRLRRRRGRAARRPPTS